MAVVVVVGGGQLHLYIHVKEKKLPQAVSHIKVPFFNSALCTGAGGGGGAGGVGSLVEVGRVVGRGLGRS